jgi:hypothetical protein
METENLLASLFKQLDEHIKRLVDKQVAEIMQSHATLAFMDEKLEDRIKEVCANVSEDIIDEAITKHERDNEHQDEDQVHDIAVSALENYDLDDKICQAMRDSDTPDESRVEEMISQAIDDIEFSEKVEDVLSSNDVWGSGSKFETLVKKVMQNTEFTVSIN